MKIDSVTAISAETADMLAEKINVWINHFRAQYTVVQISFVVSISGRYCAFIAYSGANA